MLHFWMIFVASVSMTKINQRVDIGRVLLNVISKLQLGSVSFLFWLVQWKNQSRECDILQDY